MVKVKVNGRGLVAREKSGRRKAEDLMLHRTGQRGLLAAQSLLRLDEFLLVGAEHVLHIGQVVLECENLLVGGLQFLPVAEKGVHHEREGDDQGENCAGDGLIALRHCAPQQIGLVSLHGT